MKQAELERTVGGHAYVRPNVPLQPAEVERESLPDRQAVMPALSLEGKPPREETR